MVPQGKVAIAEFHGRTDAWGTVMRTIKASSSCFASMTTVGQRIAAACDDGTVGIYDSVTGALRLSLSPADPVQTIKGSPDGSMLFCAHRGPSVTAWDIQTGGLVRTFTLDGEVTEIAISLEGRYIACGLSDGTVRIWELSGKTKGAAFGSGSPISHLCWLKSGTQLVVVQEAPVKEASAKKASVKEALVQVWDVVAPQLLRSYKEQGSIRGAVYYQKLNEIAIAVNSQKPTKNATVATSETESIVATVNSWGRTLLANPTQLQISCFAFSQISKELVCGLSTPGIGLLNISTGNWRRFNHPATITSISTFPNGTVVANVAGSGIQLLSLDEGYTPPQQLSALTVHALDGGNIIAVSFTNPKHVTLLESPTMSPLLTIHVPPIKGIQIDRSAILCASLQHRVAVHHIEHLNGTILRLRRFGSKTHEWDCRINGYRVVGGLSPSGSRLVVLHEVNHTIDVRIWDVRNGELQAHRQITATHPHTQPLGVEFKLEERFYSQHDTYRILCVIFSSKPAASSDPVATLQPDTSSDTLLESDAPVEPTLLRPRFRSRLTIRFKKLAPSGQLGRYYNLDDTREWVTCPTKRICWIPPGYIGSDNDSCCWVGNTLVMVGHDGVLRRLIFREPLEGQEMGVEAESG